MKTELLVKKSAIVPEQLIGTKWTSWKKIFGDRISVEFVDRTNCIYTSMLNKFNLRYSIEGGIMFISSIKGSFELVGSVLYNNDIPAFEKTA